MPPHTVAAIKHKEKRTNIPTEETRDFMTEEQKQAQSLLYPRDPSLDPQLVWKGKDEQDAAELAVPVLPVYIQEKIHPQAIVEDVKLNQTNGHEPHADLFAHDFNGITFEELIDFYQHEQSWANRMILGDSLLVMNSLAEKEGMRGKVQMIYMDPPYGIKFGSNWQVSTRKRDVKDTAADASREPEVVKAFRDTWELGIHSYLAYLRDRLTVARELLTESGSVFVQIGDENVHLVRCVLDEVFGSENFVAQIAFAKTSGYATNFLTGVCDYILWYGKAKEQTKFRQLYNDKVRGDAGATKYNRVRLADCTSRSLKAKEKTGDLPLPDNARLWVDDNLTSQGNPLIEFTHKNKKFSGTYKTTTQGLTRLAKADRVYVAKGSHRYIRFIDDFSANPQNAAWMDIGGVQSRVDPKIYVVQTATEAVKRCLLMTTDPGDLVLDPTCGSGTTAYVAEQWGRRWITTDTSRVSLALARTRIMGAKYPFYLLQDTPDGKKKEQEVSGIPQEGGSGGDIRKGFVYKRVPHVTLKSIANNEEIDVIHAKWQAKLEPLRAEINKLTKQSYEEWEMPREPEKSWPEAAANKLAQWWELRRQRQEEIDASIAQRADQELLYDQPYEDKKRVRVAGPFTVESLSPHRRLDIAEQPRATQRSQGDYVAMLLEHLLKSGVQNNRRNERLKFDRLEPFAGDYLHAAGEYTDADSKVKRVAVCFGPEHGTVDGELVKQAAKEAVLGVGFDVLVVCGFAFSAEVGEETGQYRRFNNLTVLPAKMNPDLAMGDELLKKTGSGNLFMVFGEPDMEVKQENGKVTVEIRGLDVYDPTTGVIRSDATDDIACWFIDTNYNGESFFVRHAYFTGANDPYKQLKKALRAEINEEAWEQLYTTKSRPFTPPKTGKIAIKVINHYGDEVLKVVEVEKLSAKAA